MGARVAIAGDLVLDFSGLFEKKAQPESHGEPRLEAGEIEDTAEAQKPAEGPTEAPESRHAKLLCLTAQREREAYQRSIEIYREYQDNTKTSERLQAEILKGIQAGEDVYSLFLQAAKAVSLMTHNPAFYSQAEADLLAIYGRGLQHRAPLQIERREAEKRLQRLLEAEQRETARDAQERIHKAIEAHRKTIAELGAMILQTTENQDTERDITL